LKSKRNSGFNQKSSSNSRNIGNFSLLEVPFQPGDLSPGFFLPE
jgi:hypothetical protein